MKRCGAGKRQPGGVPESVRLCVFASERACVCVRAFGEGGKEGERVKEGVDPGARIWRSRAGSREACERGLEW